MHTRWRWRRVLELGWCGACLALLVGALPALGSDGGVECAADTDCALRRGCPCSCCTPPLRALTKHAAEAERRRCAALGPCSEPGCERARCPPPEDDRRVVAACREGRCVKAPKSHAGADAGTR